MRDEDGEMLRNEADGLVFYQFETWAGELKHGVFTRHGGVSEGPFAALNLGGNVGDAPAAVRENHRRMYAALGIHRDEAVTVWQVHGADVVLADAPVPERRWLAEADALITNRVGLALTMRFADCTPLLFHDPVRRAIGIAHAGWRGTVQGVGTRTIAAMCQAFGSRPADIRAAIGPSIGPTRYQVGQEVVDAVHRRFGTLDGLAARADDGTWYLDLWAANARDVRQAGVREIEIAAMCTAERTDEFFSHRAEGGRTGRFGAVIQL
jgi:hypothetical protein